MSIRLQHLGLVLLCSLLWIAQPANAQYSIVLGDYTIEFLGVTTDTDNNFKWDYLVSEREGSNAPDDDVAELTAWLLGLCDGVELVSWEPTADDGAVDDVNFDKLPTRVYQGIEWEVDDDFDGDGNPDGDSRVFSIVLPDAFTVGPAPVEITAGGEVLLGSIFGPFCMDCGDLSKVPFWDGNLLSNGDGTGGLVLKAANGLTSIELGAPSNNLTLLEVQDPNGNPIADYLGSLPMGGTENDGFGRFDLATGAPVWDEVILVIGALEQGGSSFFLHIADDCGATLRVDPALSLFGSETDAAEADVLPERVVLHQNYPNPFNPTTSLRFELPEAAAVRLAVYDMLGREVALLAAGAFEAGVHAVGWEGRDAAGAALPSGIYLYRLTAGDVVQVRALFLLK